MCRHGSVIALLPPTRPVWRERLAIWSVSCCWSAIALRPKCHCRQCRNNWACHYDNGKSVVRLLTQVWRRFWMPIPLHLDHRFKYKAFYYRQNQRTFSLMKRSQSFITVQCAVTDHEFLMVKRLRDFDITHDANDIWKEKTWLAIKSEWNISNSRYIFIIDFVQADRGERAIQTIDGKSDTFIAVPGSYIAIVFV